VFSLTKMTKTVAHTLNTTTTTTTVTIAAAAATNNLLFTMKSLYMTLICGSLYKF